MSNLQVSLTPFTPEGFYGLHGDQLLGALTLVFGNSQDAEQAARHAFREAGPGWRRVAGSSDPGTWLFTTALRRSRSAPSAVSEGAPDVTEPSLAQAFYRLTVEERTGLVLRFMYGAGEAPRVRGLRRSDLDLALAALGRVPTTEPAPIAVRLERFFGEATAGVSAPEYDPQVLRSADRRRVVLVAASGLAVVLALVALSTTFRERAATDAPVVGQTVAAIQPTLSSLPDGPRVASPPRSDYFAWKVALLDDRPFDRTWLGTLDVVDDGFVALGGGWDELGASAVVWRTPDLQQSWAPLGVRLPEEAHLTDVVEVGGGGLVGLGWVATDGVGSETLGLWISEAGHDFQEVDLPFDAGPDVVIRANALATTGGAAVVAAVRVSNPPLPDVVIVQDGLQLTHHVAASVFQLTNLETGEVLAAGSDEGFATHGNFHFRISPNDLVVIPRIELESVYYPGSGQATIDLGRDGLLLVLSDGKYEVVDPATSSVVQAGSMWEAQRGPRPTVRDATGSVIFDVPWPQYQAAVDEAFATSELGPSEVDAMLLRTSDGRNWTQVKAPAGVQPDLGFAVVSGPDGFLLASANMLWLSADGRRWQTIPGPAGASKLTAVQANDGYVLVGEIDRRPALWRSVGGASWGDPEFLPPPASSRITLTEIEAVATGSFGTVAVGGYYGAEVPQPVLFVHQGGVWVEVALPSFDGGWLSSVVASSENVIASGTVYTAGRAVPVVLIGATS